MTDQAFSNVWDALADTPQEALNLKLRSQLMLELNERIKSEGWCREEAAKRLGVTRPRLDELVNESLSRFDLNALIDMVANLGDDLELLVKRNHNL